MLLTGLVLTHSAAAAAVTQQPTAPSKPRLVVLLTIDQLRPDRIGPQLPGGLGRLSRDGFVFSHATLNHGLTNTCPGHVVVSTGVNPNKAGIPGNSYVDHDTLEQRYCVDTDDPAHQVYGGTERRAPTAITVSTIGDWLKAAEPGARVFSISGKDRAAITMGGHQADGVYWYSDAVGAFTSSAYYPPLPQYVHAFNGTDFFSDGFAARFPERWEHGPGTLRPDDYHGEADEHGRSSGHPLNSGDQAARAEQIRYSPYLDTATAALTKQVFLAEQLGQRGVTDLLAVSFSATDTVGHLYGPFSAEAEDALAVLDAEIGQLLALLDESLEGDYLLALTADHGVMPLPEWLADNEQLTCSLEDGRLNPVRSVVGLYWSLYWAFTAPFGNPADLVGYSAAGFTVHEGAAREAGTSVAEVVAWLENYFESQAGTREAWTETEILTGTSDTAALLRNSYVPGKSGHLMLQLEETCVMTSYSGGGTTHGTVYHYDRHIPMIFYGSGVRTGRSADSRHSIDIAPTLGKRLGLPLPVDLDGRALDIWQAE